jgi:hypothetical protein
MIKFIKMVYIQIFFINDLLSLYKKYLNLKNNIMFENHLNLLELYE